MSYTPSNLPKMRESLIAAKQRRDNDERMAGGVGSYGIPGLETAIEVCEMGWSCEWTSQGLRVETDPPVIFATQKQKFRIVGKGAWNPYTHIAHVLPEVSPTSPDVRTHADGGEG